MLATGVRVSGLQFDDDLNSYLLPGYAVWHVSARRKLKNGLALNLQVDNLLDHVIIAGLTPTQLLGAPRQVRAGVRWTVR
jgi:outer membrane receptor for ferric coprogen and ferric-rhodotorulic acid